MASMDQAISVLSLGGKVIVVDGFDAERMVDITISEPQWWLLLMPGMIEPFADALKRRMVPTQRDTVVGLSLIHI